MYPVVGWPQRKSCDRPSPTILGHAALVVNFKQLPGTVCSLQLYQELQQLRKVPVQFQSWEVERAFSAVGPLFSTVEQVFVAVWQLLCRMFIVRLILLIKTITI